jgi:hypothetical protein
MKHSLLISALGLSAASFASAQLIITGVIDGPLSDGTPKAVELYVLEDIPDLSIYGFGGSNNGSSVSNVDLDLSGSATAGSYLYISDSGDTAAAGFSNYFGFTADFVTSSAGINGDDVVQIFKNGAVIDAYGEIGVDGTGKDWEYLDSWAYRFDGTIASATFDIDDWLVPGKNTLVSSLGTAALDDLPFGTFSPDGGIGAIPEPSSLSMLVGLIAGFGLIRRRR